MIFDSAPFYFPAGLVPSPSADIVLDLSAGERQSFSVDVYDWDPNDVLAYRWSFTSSDFIGELGSGELRSPSPINDAWVHRVEPVSIATCGEFLRREGDVVLLRLDVFDEIPERQRFDEFAESYQFSIGWRVVGSGECP